MKLSTSIGVGFVDALARLFFVVVALFAQLCLGTHQDAACGTKPGQAAVPHAVGNFTFPNGAVPSFSAGSQMNISWVTTFSKINLWLISGCDFANPSASIISGTTQTYWIWTTQTTTTNTSEVYSFRVVDADGSTSDQQSGGFWSAVFYLSSDTLSPSSSSSSSFSTRGASSTTTVSTSSGTTSGTSSTTMALSTVASSASSPTPSESSDLSTGAKAGIGIGVGLAAVGIFTIAVLIYFRKKKAREGDSPAFNPIQAMPMQEQYKPAEPYSYYAPAELFGDPTADQDQRTPPVHQLGRS